jgi:hypothetical protein
MEFIINGGDLVRIFTIAHNHTNKYDADIEQEKEIISPFILMQLTLRENTEVNEGTKSNNEIVSISI